MSTGRMLDVESLRHDIVIDVGGVTLDGTLTHPRDAQGLVLFAHGSGSSRHSRRNQYVAQILQTQHIATLLFDLLTRKEESIDQKTGELRFDIALLANRLINATRWAQQNLETKDLKLAYFGASTGAGAALVAAAELPNVVSAVVSRGGRPDLAAGALGAVRAPTLLIVGGDDHPVIDLNRSALAQLGCNDRELVIIPGATHLFEEPGKLEDVARIAGDWFMRYLKLDERTLVHI